MGLNVRDQPLAPLFRKGLHGSGHADAVKAHAPECIRRKPFVHVDIFWIELDRQIC